MGDLFSKLMDGLDKKTVITVSVVVLAMLLVVSIVGKLGRTSWTRDYLNDTFGLSDTVMADVSKAVDSGYSRTFVFTSDPRLVTLSDREQSLNFYAEPSQYVYLFARGSYRSPEGRSYPPNTIPFRISVDSKTTFDVGIPTDFPYHSPNEIIGKELGGTEGPQGFDLPSMHVLTITPTGRFTGTITIDMVLLVANTEIPR